MTMMMMPLSTFYVPSTVYGVIAAAAAAAKSLLSCPTLCNPRDGSLPGSSVSPHQSESESKVTQSCPTVCDPWTVAHQASPSMGFSRQEYWSGLPFPSPGDLLDPGIEPRSPTLQADTLTWDPPGKPSNTRIQSLRDTELQIQVLTSKISREERKPG